MSLTRWKRGMAKVLLAAAVFFGVSLAQAQVEVRENETLNETWVEPVAPEAETMVADPEREVVQGATDRRDPFSPTDKLLSRKQGPVKRRQGPVFTPVTPEIKIPKMRLRGHLQGKEGEIVALLEIAGGDVHIVREGDTVGLHDFGIDSVILIREISRLHLVIESGSLGQLIIVR